MFCCLGFSQSVVVGCVVNTQNTRTHHQHGINACAGSKPVQVGVQRSKARRGRVCRSATPRRLFSTYMSRFTKTVALEVAETGVTCNAICPGTFL